MQQWYQEEWRFIVTVLGVGKHDSARECRVGLEPGDSFSSTYACPAGFCPKSVMKTYPIMEAVRSGGDLRALGGDGPHSIELVCPDGVVRFRLTAERI